VISVDELAARQAPLTLAPMTFALANGIHVLLGGPPDGGTLLLAVLAGRARVRRGRAVVLDKPPGDVSTRRAIALIPRASSLPEALTVAEMLDGSARIRGDAPSAADARLEQLGIASLAPRPIRSLSLSEAHAVALAEAITSPTVRVLLLEEPFASVDPRASVLLAERLRERAKGGAAILVATASARDATTLATSVLILSNGKLVRHGSTLESVAPSGSHRVHVVASDPRALVAALARDAAVSQVALDGDAIVVEGGDRTAVANAIARAAVDGQIDLVEMRSDRGGAP
jgi:ABC-2 type transport system ATP-binding protein